MCVHCVHVFVGPEFEGRIRLNEAGNTKFNFLNPHDPYHAYYRHKIVEIQEGVAQEAAATQQQTGLKVCTHVCTCRCGGKRDGKGKCKRSLCSRLWLTSSMCRLD